MGETGYEEAIYISGEKNKCAAVKELFRLCIGKNLTNRMSDKKLQIFLVNS